MDTTTAELTIADIEHQIIKVQNALDNARKQQKLNAEKALISAQKAVTLAQNKLNDLRTKLATTPAAKTRLATAQTTLARNTEVLIQAENALSSLLSDRKASVKIAKKTVKILKKSNKGKKTKAEKKLNKQAKKIAKEIAIQEHEKIKDLIGTSATTSQTKTAEAKVSSPSKTKPVRKARIKPTAAAIESTSAEVTNSTPEPKGDSISQNVNVESVTHDDKFAVAEEQRVSIER